jgi:hypothetical protein
MYWAAQNVIILLDVTYTDDLTVKERFQQKLDHHNTYFAHLQSLGWRPKLYRIVLTHSGCVTLSLRTFLATDCGLTATAVDTFIKCLQQHTLNSNSNLSFTWYHLKKQLRSNLVLSTWCGLTI